MTMRVAEMSLAGAVGILLWGQCTDVRAEVGGRLPVSNEAAVMGGAVLAGGRDVGSLWYNPAILGRVRSTEVEANAEVYGIRWLRADQGAVFEGREGSTVSPLRSVEVVSVPTMFATAFALSPTLTIGVGIYAPMGTNFDAQAEVPPPDDGESEGGGNDSAASIRYRRASQRFHVALGLGWNVNDDFQVGISLVPFYDELRSEQRVFVAQPTMGDRPQSSYLFDEDTTLTSFGLSSKLGIRGRLGRLVHGAAAVEAPRWVIAQSIDRVQSTAQLYDDTASTGSNETKPLLSVGVPLRGWAFSTGLSVGEDRWLVSADASASIGEPRASWGARAGARFEVTERIAMGAGAFFDSNDSVDETLGALQMVSGGGSMGIEIRKHFDVVGRGKRRSQTLEFRTVLAAQYTHGRGRMGGVRIVGATEQTPVEFIVDGTPARLHMVLAHIGSSIAF